MEWQLQEAVQREPWRPGCGKVADFWCCGAKLEASVKFRRVFECSNDLGSEETLPGRYNTVRGKDQMNY